MRGIEHFNEAEKLTALAMQRAVDGDPRLPYQIRASYLAAAQVHATLAAAFAQGAMVSRFGSVIHLLEEIVDEQRGMVEQIAQGQEVPRAEPLVTCNVRPYPAGSEGDDGTACGLPAGHDGPHDDGQPAPWTFVRPTPIVADSSCPEPGCVLRGSHPGEPHLGYEQPVMAS